ncbi:sensor histidine kinase [Anaerobacillus isosaccharinicus]|uniref:histidine kinase n=1 Tax=Anaerobacillus isosaccharinicus TaxID=1532552 RepID=A0A1S2LHN8_9BACI|nr:HAMP domain-containing sensor histidine kinase [Anaerobacillus isosaccharinicus]QOY36893.1 HAMP domain-containing histidine kinase [Anaerobacillus isosaccharinicus]
MNLNRIDLKLGATISALFLALLFPLGFVIHEIFSGFYFKNVEENTQQISYHYASLIANNHETGIYEALDLIATLSQVLLYVVDNSGNVIVSNAPYIHLGDKITLEELSNLRRGFKQENIYDETHHKTYYISGSSIFKDDQFIGAVYILTPIESVIASLEKIRSLIFFAALGSFLLATGFTLILSKKLSNPLVKMERATRKIAKGDLNTRLVIRSKDEIGSLGTAINDLAMDLKRYRDSRSEFFANISHELRTPLTYLKGYSRVLKEELYNSNEEKLQYLNIIDNETTRLTNLINDLSDLSMIEEGKIVLNNVEIDITQIVEDVFQKTKYRAEQKGLLFSIKVPSEVPFIYGDGLRLEQIFINLIENAIRYTDNGTICLEILVDEKEVKIIIKDTGIGISKENLQFIFERFFRLEKSRSRKYGGSGLGLSIVKKLVELQNGAITVESKVNIGTKVVVIFPLS